MWQLSDLAGGQRPDYGLTRHIENGDRHMCVECDDFWRIQTTDPRGSGGERGREGMRDASESSIQEFSERSEPFCGMV